MTLRDSQFHAQRHLLMEKVSADSSGAFQGQGEEPGLLLSPRWFFPLGALILPLLAPASLICGLPWLQSPLQKLA